MQSSLTATGKQAITQLEKIHSQFALKPLTIEPYEGYLSGHLTDEENGP